MKLNAEKKYNFDHIRSTPHQVPPGQFPTVGLQVFVLMSGFTGL